MTSGAMPISGPPISSQAREIAIRKQNTTRIAIVFTSEASLATSPGAGEHGGAHDHLEHEDRGQPDHNSASRTMFHRTWCRRISDSSGTTSRAMKALSRYRACDQSMVS